MLHSTTPSFRRPHPCDVTHHSVTWHSAEHLSTYLPGCEVEPFLPGIETLSVGGGLSLTLRGSKATLGARSHRIVGLSLADANVAWSSAAATFHNNAAATSVRRWTHRFYAAFVLRRAHSFDIGFVTSEPLPDDDSILSTLSGVARPFPQAELRFNVQLPFGAFHAGMTLSVRWFPTADRVRVGEPIDRIVIELRADQSTSTSRVIENCFGTLRPILGRPTASQLDRDVVFSTPFANGLLFEVPPGTLTVTRPGEHLLVFTLDVKAEFAAFVVSPTCSLPPFRVLSDSQT